MPDTQNIAQVPAEATGRPHRAVLGGVTLRHTFRALRHRDFRLFTAGQIVSLSGTWMQQTALGWLIYQLTNSTVMLGAVAAAGTAPMVVFSMVGGSLADRVPKRSILLVTQTCSMLLAFALAALVWFGNVTTWQIVVIAALNGVAMAFDMPARQSFVIEITSREDLLNAISLNSSVFNGARMLGPALAGYAIAMGGAGLCFFLNGLTFIAAITALALMRIPPRTTPVDAGPPLAHAAGGLRYVWNHPRLLTILSLFAIVGIFGWSSSVLLPAYVRDVLGLGANAYGTLLSMAGVGALTGGLAVASMGHRFAPRSIAFTGVAVFCVMLLVFAFSRSFALSLGAQVFLSMGMMLFFSTSNTTIQQIVPDEMRGRVMGVWTLIFGAMIPIGSMQAGALAGWIGIRWTFVSGALICAVAALVTWEIVRRREAKHEAV